MDIFKRMIKSTVFWMIAIEMIFAIILFLNGFRITYAPNLETSWDAVSAFGQWAGALVGFLIPIAAIYLQASLENNKKEIGESNSDLYNDFEKFKLEYSEKIKILSKLVDERGNIVTKNRSFSDEIESNLKEKALKFINISMITGTKNVAEHLGVGAEGAYNLLLEMVGNDESITCRGQLSLDNIDNILWMKKKRERNT